MIEKINLAEKLAQFSAHWSPRIVGALNGQHIKLAKFQGPFVWHHHVAEDEFFLVLQGSFRMDYLDAEGVSRSLEIQAGEFLIMPRGTEHRPYAADECHVLLVEPITTLNTGNTRNEFTVDQPEDLSPGRQ